jgi:polysaccharide export outer membrane protein
MPVPPPSLPGGWATCRRVGVQVLRTKIVRGIVAAGLAVLMQAATAQLGAQRPGEGVSVPNAQPQGAPVQTPAITTPPQAAKPASIAPQQPALTGQKPPEPNEFQVFIDSSTGRLLPIYGQMLFQDVPSTFAPVENIPVTPDYVIGPGDELYVRAWGQIDMDYRVTVDRNGTIAIPRVGQINVAGVRYQNITEYIKTAVSRVFRNFDLTITMGQLRSIQIFVVGQARRPGSYTVSSLSTLVNAIFAAGGPSPTGSMRSIQLKRAGKTVTDLDLYDLLLYGDKSKDAPLLPGDVIYFSPIGPLAALNGSVNTPAIYELKGETTLEKLLEWSGGLATTAQTKTATIERIDERRTRVVDKFSLDKNALTRSLRDGDLVTILPLGPRFENAVTLRGNVAVPLRYPYAPGMRVRDLIPDKDALITYDYYRRQNRAVQTEFLRERVRSGAETTAGTLERGTERESAAEREARTARPDRPDRSPRPEERSARGSTPEKLFAEINWDYAVVERLNESDFSTTLIPFNLGKAILENDDTHNLVLKPGDIVTIFSKEDISVPVARQTKLVRLEGEFTFSGIYQALPGETLRQLIVRVGGLAPDAYVFGTEFTRESVRAQQQKSYQDTLNRIERDLQSQSAEKARSTLAPEDAESLKVAQASQLSIIARLRELKPTGRVGLELPEDAKITDLPDIALEDGDRIFIPSRPAMVSVFGSVFTEGSFLHRPGRSVTDYVALAGGTTKRADTGQIFVLRADGSASGQGRGFFGSVRVMPGDTIVVPEDFERQSWTRILRDWSQILYQFGLGAAAIKVLRGS